MERWDHLYIQLANEAGGIQQLIGSFFSFLLRRTDFFYESDPGDAMGFPPGVARRMIENSFTAHQDEYYKKHPAKSIDEFMRKKELLARQPTAPPPASSPSPPALPPTADPRFTDISTYNGGATEKYKWSQGTNEVNVQVNLPRPTKAKDLSVTLEPEQINVHYKSDGAVVLVGPFFDRIKAAESSWIIEEGQRLVLMLDKAEDNIWKTVLKGDSEIDTTTVDNSKKLEDFDEETQGALRKVLYEQQRKNLGLPTTEEEQQMELLKRAWNAQDSPFKGTPFDPSRLNIPANQQPPK